MQAHKWTSDQLAPLSEFLTYMASAITEGRMQKTLNYLQIVLCHEQKVPSMVIEAVNYIHTTATNESNTCMAQSDSGLAAVFACIQQGKTLLKSAHSKALQAQKETGQWQELTNVLNELTKFMNTMPESTSSSFEWETALSLGIKAVNQMVEAQTQSTVGSSSKTFLGNAKKSISEFVTIIGKAFLKGIFQTWIVQWTSQYAESKTIMKELPVSIKSWQDIKCKHLTKDAASVLQCAVDTNTFILDFSSMVATMSDPNASAFAAVDLLKLLEAFEKNTWPSVKEMNVLDPSNGLAAYDSLKVSTQSISSKSIVIEIQATKKALGTIMAKAWVNWIYRMSYTVGFISL